MKIKGGSGDLGLFANGSDRYFGEALFLQQFQKGFFNDPASVTRAPVCLLFHGNPPMIIDTFSKLSII